MVFPGQGAYSHHFLRKKFKILNYQVLLWLHQQACGLGERVPRAQQCSKPLLKKEANKTEEILNTVL